MIRRFSLAAVVALVAIGASAQPAVEGYTTRSMHGFYVLVLDEGTTAHPAQMQTALDELGDQLQAITALGLPETVMDRLREVKIFVDWAQTTGGAQYHPSRQWLADNGYEPEKERSVEISNAVNFAQWSRQNQPWMVFHELTHAYHHQVLGFGHEGTLAAYRNARDSGILDSVPYNPGPGQAPFNRVAYARNNEIEYLAEISEAYVGEHDFYPFVRSDLEAYDPQGYALVAAIWAAGATSEAARPTPLAAFEIYPNPTVGGVVLNAAETLAVTVHDVTGRIVLTAAAGVGRTRLDLGGLPSGVYLVRAEGHRGVASQMLVRAR